MKYTIETFTKVKDKLFAGEYKSEKIFLGMTLMRVFLELAYDGTRYHGWQRQPQSITVQEVLEDTGPPLWRALSCHGVWSNRCRCSCQVLRGAC